MFLYALKRFLVFVPTFFIISLLIFGLSKLAPGDPVELLLKGGQSAGAMGQRADLVNSERAYQDKARELGLDRPTFYFAVTSAAYPADLYLIKKQNHREIISRLIDRSGNAEAVMAYYNALRAFELKAFDVLATAASAEARTALRDPLNDIYFKHQDGDIKAELDKMKAAIAADPALSAALSSEIGKLQSAYQYILDNPKTGNLYVPTLHAYGFNNQYHTWMFGDYPWFSTPDTMAKFQLDGLNARLNVASKDLDSLNVKARKDAENLRDARLQIELLSDAEINKDSLRQAIEKMLADSAALAQNISTRSIEMQKVEKERDLIAEKVVVYASKGFLRFDFGKSYRTGDSVGKMILQAMFWTVIMNFISIFLSYIISIPLGVQSAVWKKNSLQFFNVLSYHALLTTLAYSVSMVLYAKGIIGSGTHLMALVACMLVYLLVDFYQQRRYVLESFSSFSFANLAKERGVLVGFLAGTAAIALLGWLSGSGAKFYYWTLGLGLGGYLFTAFRAYIFPIVYIFSLAMIMFWSFIIAEMLLFGAGLLLIRSPKLLIFVAVLVAIIAGVRYYLRRRNAAALAAAETKKLWDDGKGNFQLGKTGIQTRGKFLDGFSTAMLFILYSIPSFWIATILLVFLTVASYGISWFPTGGAYTMELHQNAATPMSTYIIDVLHHLVLPVFCMTYGSFAFLSRQTRGSMLGVLRQDYIRTANAKGLAEEKVIWKHAFRNSLFPIITLFSSVFPRALSGSIAIELIFNIPGMGQLALTSITARDWPLVFAISMLAAVLTMIGNLIADLLYGVADPRVTFK